MDGGQVLETQVIQGPRNEKKGASRAHRGEGKSSLAGESACLERIAKPELMYSPFNPTSIHGARAEFFLMRGEQALAHMDNK